MAEDHLDLLDGGAGTGNAAGARDEALTAVTLRVAASRVQPALQPAPRLAVVRPTKGCGKSRVLDVLHETVHQPLMTVNTSSAAVFRVIGQNPPALLVDEADTIFGPKAGTRRTCAAC